MNRFRAAVIGVVFVLVALVGVSIAACGSAAPTATAPRPTVTKTITKVVRPKHHHHPAPTATAPAPAPAPPSPAANSMAVVDQFYQDITNHDYLDAWNLGGDNLSGGVGYNAWVAGYDTTQSITLATGGTWDGDTVNADIVATQTNGVVKTYSGTYTVVNGVIQSANIVQTS